MVVAVVAVVCACGWSIVRMLMISGVKRLLSRAAGLRRSMPLIYPNRSRAIPLSSASSLRVGYDD